LQRIHRLARRKGEAGEVARLAAYARLCRIARIVVRQVERVRTALTSESAEHPQPDPAAERLVGEIDRLVPLARRVIDQTVRRVLRDEQVPAAEKVASLVEPHTAVIPRHKAGQHVEFGRKLWLAEVDGGIISDVGVLDGAPPDARRSCAASRAIAASSAARRTCSPAIVVARRPPLDAMPPRPGSVASPCPRPDHRPRPAGPASGSAGSDAAIRWRSGIVGRIGVLRRVYGFDRCPAHGPDGIERWVGLGVLTADLAPPAAA
jgi:IS5 family transposase